MFLKDETKNPIQKNLKIAFSNKLTGPYTKASDPITGNYWAEGPTVMNIDGNWIVYFDKYKDHKHGAIKSKDLKTWEDISDEIKFPKGTRHGSVFKISLEEFNYLQHEIKN